MTSVANDLALALEMADAADALTLDRFGALDLRVDTKPDLTPVTDADRSAEELLRSSLTTHRPDDSVFGEELGGTPAFTGRQWVLDPIDGTKNFVRGVPVWSTLIALLVDGTPVVGVVSAPALGRRWWAGEGEGAFTSFGGAARRISVSGVDDLGSASLSFSDLTTGWDARRSRFIDLTDAVWRVRALRRLLVLLPGGRGCRRYRHRARGEAVGPRPARHPRARGGRRVHEFRGATRDRTAAAPSRPTDCSTMRCWPG